MLTPTKIVTDFHLCLVHTGVMEHIHFFALFVKLLLMTECASSKYTLFMYNKNMNDWKCMIDIFSGVQVKYIVI